ncbi:TlpA family protein disulfide reductase [Nocardioides sp. TRM66260-LWL]|uniref:TlpA family protein disulfide reductase n=1 Tax=Nocardioides sp. TRM66260-LWL TaxID=2874478 RepID=UPI001CC4F05E|nr:TlpA disulfide reductase family protein [Nocardioides sp. TRM66260-LWL]MBZ5736396.1 TlpA family protein disulfide reductase [Nocardioides sp. TRM66260-LWL]
MLLIIVSVVGIGWWQVRHLKATAGNDGSNAGVGLTLYRGDAGIALPTISGKTVDGKSLDLADLHGHVLVLNVWGSWCAPCRAEAPDLSRIAAETAPRGVRFVGIDVRDNPAAARAFASNYAITYPSFDDQNGLVLAQFTGIIPVSAVPSTLVVDRAGVIRARVVGQVDGNTLRGLIEDTEKLS